MRDGENNKYLYRKRQKKEKKVQYGVNWQKNRKNKLLFGGISSCLLDVFVNLHFQYTLEKVKKLYGIIM